MTVKTPSLDQLIDSYLVCCMTEGKSPKTIEFYSTNLKRFNRFLKGNHLAASIADIGNNARRRHKREICVPLDFNSAFMGKLAKQEKEAG